MVLASPYVSGINRTRYELNWVDAKDTTPLSCASKSAFGFYRNPSTCSSENWATLFMWLYFVFAIQLSPRTFIHVLVTIDIWINLWLWDDCPRNLIMHARLMPVASWCCRYGTIGIFPSFMSKLTDSSACCFVYISKLIVPWPGWKHDRCIHFPVISSVQHLDLFVSMYFGRTCMHRHIINSPREIVSCTQNKTPHFH